MFYFRHVSERRDGCLMCPHHRRPRPSYQVDTPRPSPRTNRTRRVPRPVLIGPSRQLGIDAKVLASIINASSGRSWSSDTYNPCPGVMEGVPAARGYAGGFACDLMIKDLSLAASAAASSAPPPVLTGHVSSLPRTKWTRLYCPPAPLAAARGAPRHAQAAALGATQHTTCCSASSCPSALPLPMRSASVSSCKQSCARAAAAAASSRAC